MLGSFLSISMILSLLVHSNEISAGYVNVRNVSWSYSKAIVFDCGILIEVAISRWIIHDVL